MPGETAQGHRERTGHATFEYSRTDKWMCWACHEQCAPWCLNGHGGPGLGCNCGAEERNLAARASRSSTGDKAESQVGDRVADPSQNAPSGAGSDG